MKFRARSISDSWKEALGGAAITFVLQKVAPNGELWSAVIPSLWAGVILLVAAALWRRPDPNPGAVERLSVLRTSNQKLLAVLDRAAKDLRKATDRVQGTLHGSVGPTRRDVADFLVKIGTVQDALTASAARAATSDEMTSDGEGA